MMVHTLTLDFLINRLTSLDENGLVACSGFEDKTATNRLIHYVTESGYFTPHEIGSIIVPMHDLYYHNTKVVQHLPFIVSDPDKVLLTVDKPTVIVEFIKETQMSQHLLHHG